MPRITVGFGLVLIALGLFGYFGSAAENPSPTALIPAAFGVVLAACGLVALNPGLRKHAMHGAATVALVGAIAALVRAIPRLGLAASDDLTISRPVRLQFLMAIVCLVFVGLCVQSFIAARRRRTQATND